MEFVVGIRTVKSVERENEMVIARPWIHRSTTRNRVEQKCIRPHTNREMYQRVRVTEYVLRAKNYKEKKSGQYWNPNSF